MTNTQSQNATVASRNFFIGIFTLLSIAFALSTPIQAKDFSNQFTKLSVIFTDKEFAGVEKFPIFDKTFVDFDKGFTAFEKFDRSNKSVVFEKFDRFTDKKFTSFDKFPTFDKSFAAVEKFDRFADKKFDRFDKFAGIDKKFASFDKFDRFNKFNGIVS